jgi:hypothetical protein
MEHVADGRRATDRTPTMVFAGAALVGAFIAVAAGVYGSVHDPASETTVKWFFTSTLHLKAWFTTVALVLAILQVIGGMWMYGKLPGARSAPLWVGPAHRISGSLALLVSLPVAYHCLWALGFQSDAGWRPLLHGLFGCAFYGAFTTKLLCLRSDRLPRWGLPVVGGLLVTLLTGAWLTSAVWFFTTVDFPAFR